MRNLHVVRRLHISFVTLAALLSFLVVGGQQAANAELQKMKVKVFIGSMFEIGKNTGDRAGEFQFWYDGYWPEGKSLVVKGAENPVFYNKDGVVGSVLGMGKTRSSSSMTAILLDPRFDFSGAYFLITGVAGTPPERGTIASVFWGSHLVDYDLGHRWAPEEGEPGKPTFMPRKGYEYVRRIELNQDLVQKAFDLTDEVPLKDSDTAKAYRKKYPQKVAQRLPFLGIGSHFSGDCFWHGPGLSAETQYIAELYQVNDYVITEMEAVAVAYVIRKIVSLDRVLSLRAAVNFDQGNPNEGTLEHLDPAPGETPGGFGVGLENLYNVGSTFVNEVVNNWDKWK